MPIDPIHTVTSSDPEDIEQARAEALQFEAATGRRVIIREEAIECPNGKLKRRLRWSAADPCVEDAVKLLVQVGAQPLRDEDGIVRLHWPLEADEPYPHPSANLEQNANGFANPSQPAATPTAPPPTSSSWVPSQPPPEITRGYFEQTAWPIHSPEAAALINHTLFTKGSRLLTPRELKQAAQVLEGRALKSQKRIDRHEMANRNPLLETVLDYLAFRPEGYRGTASSFVIELENYCRHRQLDGDQSPDFPKTARVLSMKLKQLEKWINDAGFSFDRGKAGANRCLSLFPSPKHPPLPQPGFPDQVVPAVAESAADAPPQAPDIAEPKTLPNDAEIAPASQTQDAKDADISETAALAAFRNAIIAEVLRRRTLADAGFEEFRCWSSASLAENESSEDLPPNPGDIGPQDPDFENSAGI